MRVFLTGATSFFGSLPFRNLSMRAMVGRGNAGAKALTHAEAEVFRSDVNALDRLRTAAEAANALSAQPSIATSPT